jgi:hypothetical protein
LLVQLWKAITARRPRCPVFRKDVTVRADFRVVIEKTGWNPGPQTARFRHWRRRTAKPTERTTVSGRLLPNRQLEHGDAFAALYEAEVRNFHTDFGKIGRTGGLPTPAAVTQFEWAHNPIDFESNSAA